MRIIILSVYLMGLIFLAPQSALSQEADDSYDPFSDYSEYEAATEEEADIHFFKNGRFFTVGFAGGVKSFTGNLGKLYESSPTFGIFLSYFFDLRFALQVGFNTSDHGFGISKEGHSLSGNVSMTALAFNLKYFLSSQNITRQLANLNPYIIGGLSQNYRTYSLNSSDTLGKDSTMGADLGFGVELPMLRKKGYFGIQGTYHLVSFADENKTIIIPDGLNKINTGVKPNGDYYDILFIAGLNF